MSVYAVKANEVLATVLPDQGAAAPGDHPFLDLLKEWLPKLLPMLLACLPVASRNAAGLAAALNNPTRRQRRQLRWFIDDHIDDPRTGNLSVDEIESAMVKMASGCTEADATAMMAA